VATLRTDMTINRPADEVADTLGPAIEDGVRGLKEYCEQGS
jgi:hypothetical protein